MMREVDKYFAAKGATHYHDSMYPRRFSLQSGQYTAPGGLFSRHYFRADGLEIGYYIPDIGVGPHDLEQPRVWGIPHELEKLSVAK